MIVDSATGEYVYPGTFMSLDIFFLMYIYNYNPETGTWNIPNFNEEDTTYVLEGPFFMTIHDTGGVDTLDLTAYSFENIYFDLNFYGPSWDDVYGWINSYKHNEIGTDLLDYGSYSSGYVLNISPFTVIELSLIHI